MPLAVDGAQNPERIPDKVAYRHFISVTAVNEGASEREIFRRDAFLAAVRLAPGDRMSYLAAVRNVREELLAIDQQTQHMATANPEAVSGLRLQRARVLDDAVVRTLKSLSPDGVQRVRAHIDDHVKKRIKIYGEAQ